MSAHLDFHHHRVRGLRMRLRAAWAREDLDRRLAEGADPATDMLLQQRAERLVRPAIRATLAAGLERVVATANKPPAALSSAIPVRCGPVRGARHELMGLAGELRHMPDPRPRGVAMAERLLTEPSSVLYTASSSDEIARAARCAADNMRPDNPPVMCDARREGLVRKASTSLHTTPTRAAEATEHHFYRATVAPLPPRAPVDSTNW
ncbi:MAG: hypothetical protein ACXVRX_14585 [Solirubrobacteraceae bacterium]